MLYCSSIKFSSIISSDSRVESLLMIYSLILVSIIISPALIILLDSEIIIIPSFIVYVCGYQWAWLFSCSSLFCSIALFDSNSFSSISSIDSNSISNISLFNSTSINAIPTNSCSNYSSIDLDSLSTSGAMGCIFRCLGKIRVFIVLFG